MIVSSCNGVFILNIWETLIFRCLSVVVKFVFLCFIYGNVNATMDDLLFLIKKKLFESTPLSKIEVDRFREKINNSVLNFNDTSEEEKIKILCNVDGIGSDINVVSRMSSEEKKEEYFKFIEGFIDNTI